MNLVREVKSAYLTKEIKRLWPKDPKSHKTEPPTPFSRNKKTSKNRAQK